MHVCNCACNVHVNIYDTHKMYVHVTDRTNKWFFEFHLINIPIFLHSKKLFVYCCFYSNLLFHTHKNIALKYMFDLSKVIQFFSGNHLWLKLSLYRYHFHFLLYIKLIRPRLRSQITFRLLLYFIYVYIWFDRLNQN